MAKQGWVKVDDKSQHFIHFVIVFSEEIFKEDRKQFRESLGQQQKSETWNKLSGTLDLTSSFISQDEDEQEEDASDKENRESFSQQVIQNISVQSYCSEVNQESWKRLLHTSC